MESLEIWIDPANPSHAKIEAEIRKNLDALESIRYSQITRTVPPGTLGLPHEVVSFTVDHYDKLIPLLTAVLTLATKLATMHKSRQRPEAEQSGKKEPKGAPPVVIVIGDHRLSFPASDASQEKFIKAIEHEVTPVPERPRPKKSTGARKSTSPRKSK